MPMSASDFNNLQYGNVIQDSQGNLFVVTHVPRNSAGQATCVGITPALKKADALQSWDIVSKSRMVTELVGKTIGHG